MSEMEMIQKLLEMHAPFEAEWNIQTRPEHITDDTVSVCWLCQDQALEYINEDSWGHMMVDNNKLLWPCVTAKILLERVQELLESNKND